MRTKSTTHSWPRASRSKWAVVTSVLLAAGGVSFAPGARAEPTEAASDLHVAFAASFGYVGGEKEKRAIEAAIDRALDGMFFAIKPIARAKLRQGAVLLPSLSFAFRDGKIQSLSSGNPPIVSPETGENISYRAADGETYRVSQRFVGTKLMQQFVAADGTRKNEYVLSEQGKTLNLAVTLSSQKLPRPLMYRLSYQKQD